MINISNGKITNDQPLVSFQFQIGLLDRITFTEDNIFSCSQTEVGDKFTVYNSGGTLLGDFTVLSITVNGTSTNMFSNIIDTLNTGIDVLIDSNDISHPSNILMYGQDNSIIGTLVDQFILHGETTLSTYGTEYRQLINSRVNSTVTIVFDSLVPVAGNYSFQKKTNTIYLEDTNPISHFNAGKIVIISEQGKTPISQLLVAASTTVDITPSNFNGDVLSQLLHPISYQAIAGSPSLVKSVYNFKVNDTFNYFRMKLKLNSNSGFIESIKTELKSIQPF